MYVRKDIAMSIEKSINPTAVNKSMERTSLYIPIYLDQILTMVSDQQGEGKAKIIRNALLRELKLYSDAVDKINQNPDKKVKPFQDIVDPDATPKDALVDVEANDQFIEELYRSFQEKNRNSFPKRTKSAA
jgi:hypothetical protein